MAADILIYDSDRVPVGKDQKQHLEVTRDIATKINLAYGEGTLKVPEALIREDTAVVAGLDGRKMSKSYNNTIGLFEEEKALLTKVKRIITDATPVEAPKPTDDSSILKLYKLVATSEEYDALVADFKKGGRGYGDYKKQLFQKIWDFFAEARDRRAQIVAQAGYVDDVLQAGAAKARVVARRTLDRVRHAVGLG